MAELVAYLMVPVIMSPEIPSARGEKVNKKSLMELPYVTTFTTLPNLNDDVLTNQRQLKIKQSSTNFVSLKVLRSLLRMVTIAMRKNLTFLFF